MMQMEPTQFVLSYDAINAFLVTDLQSKGNLYVELLQITGLHKVFTPL